MYISEFLPFISIHTQEHIEIEMHFLLLTFWNELEQVTISIG